jgi:hypothetical protein
LQAWLFWFGTCFFESKACRASNFNFISLQPFIRKSYFPGILQCPSPLHQDRPTSEHPLVLQSSRPLLTTEISFTILIEKLNQVLSQQTWIFRRSVNWGVSL